MVTLLRTTIWVIIRGSLSPVPNFLCSGLTLHAAPPPALGLCLLTPGSL